IDPDRSAGRAVVHATHEGQAVAQITFDWKGYRHMLVIAPGPHRDRLALARDTRKAEKPPEQPFLADVVRRNRVRPKEVGFVHDTGLARLRLIESRRIDHRDIVVRACDGAVAAADAHIVLKVDLTLGTTLDCARRTTVHATR